MPSYAVTGASRGMGLEFIRQLSDKPDNVLFAIVRNVQSSNELKKLADENSNVHIIRGDLTDYKSLQSAAAEVGAKTNGTLDYLINNAGYLQLARRFNKLTDYIGHDEELIVDMNENFTTNVIGVIHTINAFIPLLKNGTVKKVITISSGLGDLDVTVESGTSFSAPFSISKAAVNMVNAKYASQFKSDGFMFLALTPGFVNTLHTLPPEDKVIMREFLEQLKTVKPHWTPVMSTPADGVKVLLDVIHRFTAANNGEFVSQHGNKKWL